MTKAKHTAEPWEAHLNVPTALIEGHIIKAANTAQTPIASLWVGGGTHGKPTQMANAERIVACVNACEGIDPAAIRELRNELRQASHCLIWAAQEARGRVKAEIVGGWIEHARRAKAAIDNATA